MYKFKVRLYLIKFKVKMKINKYSLWILFVIAIIVFVVIVHFNVKWFNVILSRLNGRILVLKLLTVLGLFFFFFLSTYETHNEQ